MKDYKFEYNGNEYHYTPITGLEFLIEQLERRKQELFEDSVYDLISYGNSIRNVHGTSSLREYAYVCELIQILEKELKKEQINIDLSL